MGILIFFAGGVGLPGAVPGYVWNESYIYINNPPQKFLQSCKWLASGGAGIVRGPESGIDMKRLFVLMLWLLAVGVIAAYLYR